MIASNFDFFFFFIITQELDADYSSKVFTTGPYQWTVMSLR